MRSFFLFTASALLLAGCNGSNTSDNQVGANAISANSASEMADRGVIADPVATPTDASGYLARAGACEDNALDTDVSSRELNDLTLCIMKIL